MNKDFYKRITKAIGLALLNSYDDNFDKELSKLSSVDKLQIYATTLLRWAIKLTGRKGEANVLIFSKNNYYLEHLEQFESLYQYLSDEGSRERMIELLAYRAFGPTRVKLTLNNESYWQGRKDVEQCKLLDTVEFKNFRSNLSLFDLNSYNYDLKLFFVANGIYVDFILQQYNYNDLICVVEGDIVIDAGACWGDTALYFSSLGAKSVYAYEFIPSNLDVFKKNIALNPQYQDRIHVVETPVWNESDIPMSYDDRGPASQIGEPGKYAGSTKTLSIDDLVVKYHLESVDFIKMDIEGAEMPALKGAENTIKRFKPKLAISVYHKPDDMIVIPDYIRSLNANYEFYLDYYTVVGHEIILYAIDRNAK